MILYQYPKTVALKDGTHIVIRPLRKSDEQALHGFFLKLPLQDRLSQSEDLAEKEVVAKWIYDLDYDQKLPLVAFDNGRMVGNANLIYNNNGWAKHQAKIQVVCDPEYRKRGLSKLLVKSLIQVGIYTGIEQITADVAMSFQEGYFLFENLGFQEATVFPGFIKNATGEYDDLILMMKTLNVAHAEKEHLGQENKKILSMQDKLMRKAG